MAPSFFSKLVKSPGGGGHSRDRSEKSFESRRSPSPPPRNRAISTPSGLPPASTLSSIAKGYAPVNIDTKPIINEPVNEDSGSSTPSFTVVPPSPLSSHDGASVNVQDGPNTNGDSATNGNGTELTSSTRSRSLSTPVQSQSTVRHKQTAPPVPALPTSLAASPELSPSRPPSRPNTASSSKSNLREAFASAFGNSSKDLPAMRSKTSNISLKIDPPAPSTTTHARAVTEPNLENESISQTDIVESPTSIIPPEFPSSETQTASPNGNTGPASPPKDNKDKEKEKNNKKQTGKWKRPTQKPTGLASAIAASGLAMANPAFSAQQQAQLSPPATSRKASLPSPPYLNRTGSGSAVSAATSSHTRMGSTDFSPKSKGSKRRTSPSVNSDHSDYPDGQPIGTTDYYSGLEDNSSDDTDDTDEDDVLLDLDVSGNEIPVTGFAVASSRRNADFHELFPTIPEGDYLIEDYGCALQREILIQGRIYISENHICFHANIFGWITDLSIPIYEITTLEKKMTAFVIPNAIQITTRQNKYSFTSFLSRDTTFDVIYNIWRLARPEDANSVGSGSAGPSVDRIPEATVVASGLNGQVLATGNQAVVMQNRQTECLCGKEGRHYSEKALEMVVPGTPEKIYSLMFASGWMKEFLVVDQKLFDIQTSDWAPIEPGSKLLARNMSYIKPLNGSVGPKQTKCEIRDETEHCDFDDYICTLTTTKNPDVPSGSVFSVKTRTCIMWASQMSTKVVVSTQVEWTGRSFIKGIIERSAIEGQRVYHTALEKAVRGYITEHQSEFLPEGVDAAALAPEPIAAPDEGTSSKERDPKQREHERNQRAYQWAWDTFEGASSVASQSIKGALELLRDAWDQSSSTTILYFVIVLLVTSNIYTYVQMGKQEELGKRKAMQGTGEREKWIRGLVTALWDELSAANGVSVGLGTAPPLPSVHSILGNVPGDEGTFDVARARDELMVMGQTLDSMEARIRTMKAHVEEMVQDVSGLD